MGLRFQRYLVASDDTLYRVANAAYDRMLHDPDQHRMMLFAGQRARTAEVIVEFMGSAPVRVVRLPYSMLVFDANGRINSNAHLMQQAARVGLALSPVMGNRARTDSVIDATERFVAGGGSWKPSKNLARAIEGAALGNGKCMRLQRYECVGLADSDPGFKSPSDGAAQLRTAPFAARAHHARFIGQLRWAAQVVGLPNDRAESLLPTGRGPTLSRSPPPVRRVRQAKNSLLYGELCIATHSCRWPARNAGGKADVGVLSLAILCAARLCGGCASDTSALKIWRSRSWPRRRGPVRRHHNDERGVLDQSGHQPDPDLRQPRHHRCRHRPGRGQCADGQGRGDDVRDDRRGGQTPRASLSLPALG